MDSVGLWSDERSFSARLPTLRSHRQKSSPSIDLGLSAHLGTLEHARASSYGPPHSVRTRVSSDGDRSEADKVLDRPGFRVFRTVDGARATSLHRSRSRGLAVCLRDARKLG